MPTRGSGEGDDPLCIAAIRRGLKRRPSRTLQTDASWKHAAVAAVFRAGPRGAELLFIQRAEVEADPWSGQIAFPGGRAEATDAELVDTAIRETREELGFALGDEREVERLGPLDAMQARARTQIGPMVVQPFGFALREWADPAFTCDPSEVASAFWFPLPDLEDEGRRCFFDARRAGLPFRFPAIDLGEGRLLWGMTFHMVLEIQQRLGRVTDIEGRFRPRAISQ